MHSQKISLALYTVIVVISLIQLSAGGVSISSGKALSNNLNSMVYDIFYSLEAGYYIVVAIFSLTICTILILAELIFPSRTFLKMTGLYMLLLLLACFQFSMAICSAINATVVADQSYLFDRAGYIDSNLGNMKGIIQATAVLTWLLVLPSLGWLLMSMWEEWYKSLDKDNATQTATIDMNQQEAGRESVRKPLY